MAVTSPIHGSRVALLGTSLVQQNHDAGERHIRSSARGWSTWAEVLTNGQLDIAVFHDPRVHPGWEPSGRAGVTRGFTGLNAGVSGQKTLDIANRIDQVLALDFDLIIVDAGTNDMMVETKETIQATREAIVSRLLDAGKLVILLPILARGTQKWPAGGSERAKAHWINQKSRAFAARRARCHIFDWNSTWVDWDSADGVPHAGFSDDGTHFSVPGGHAVGKALAEYLSGLLAPHIPERWARDDRFDPVDNPLGNIVPGPLPRNANAPAGALSSDCEITASRTISSTGHPTGWQDVSLESGHCVLEILPEDFINPLPAGAWVRASCAVEVDAHDGWRDVSLVLEDCSPDGLTAQALAPFDLGDGDLAPYPNEAWSGMLRTPPIKIKMPSQRLRLALNLRIISSGRPASMRFSTPELRQNEPPALGSRR
ncbi:SGNH/GDSL hydrolase family protein [Ensifer sp. 4252]|uniref:SGNH/GDSL hydrolase family protein n=1 Tax=Ensifer sp. 4252 TaxID=3373915 RepID=UPI003D1E5CBD